MQGKGSFLILLSIIAFLSLALAVLAGYVFFVSGSSDGGEVPGKQEEINKVPAESDLALMPVFEGKTYFNLKNDNKKVEVIQLGVKIKYFKNVKGIKNTEEKMTAYESEIREVIGTYFQNLTLDEVKLPETKEKAKNDLIKSINDLLFSNEKEKNPIVYSIIFDEWFYQGGG